MLIVVSAGCAKQWENADAGNKQQTAAKFERDSVDCEVISGEKYPLDKNKQLNAYDQCMNDKGWTKRQQDDGIMFNSK